MQPKKLLLLLFTLFVVEKTIAQQQNYYIEVPIPLSEKAAVDFSADGKSIAIASENLSDKKKNKFSIQTLSLPELKATKTFAGFSDIEDLVCLADSHRIAMLESNGNKKVVKIIDSGKGVVVEIINIKPEDGVPENFTNYNKDLCIASLSYEGSNITTRLFRLSDMQKVAKATHTFSQITFSPADRKTALEAKNGTIEVYDLEQQKLVQSIKKYHKSVKNIMFSPDGKYIAATGRDFDNNPVNIWMTSGGRLLQSLVKGDIPDGNAKCYAFSPDNKYFVSIENENVRIWRTLTGKLVKEVIISDNQKKIIFSKSGEYFATCNSKGNVKIWNFKNLTSGDKDENDVIIEKYLDNINSNPDDEKGLQELGLVYKGQNNFEKAITLFSESINILPTAVAYENRGIVYAMVNDHDKALSDFNSALRYDVLSATSYLNKGIIDQVKNNNFSAIESFKKVVELNPKMYEPHFYRANIHYMNGEFDKAIKEYSVAINLNPQSYLAYFNRGLAYQANKQWDPAIGNYTKVIEINPKFSLAYSCRGIVYFNQEEDEKAMADLTKAIDLRTTTSETYNYRGILNYKKGSSFQAYSDFTSAVDFSDQEDATALFNLGLMNYADGNYLLAKEYFKKVCDLEPYNKECTYFLELAKHEDNDERKGIVQNMLNETKQNTIWKKLRTSNIHYFTSEETTSDKKRQALWEVNNPYK